MNVNFVFLLLILSLQSEVGFHTCCFFFPIFESIFLLIYMFVDSSITVTLCIM
ncbi:hypothetical protein ERO13_A08G139150v2 [Gossypium hirsutum]|nr:hypothetical protein ERO13_A08G139150v2 [Gossypium hirsutum]